MKLREMEPGVRYIVTKNGSTLLKGDRIRLEKDGALMCTDAGGWLNPSDWKRLRNEIEIDKEYYKKIARVKREELAAIERILEK